MEMLYVPNTFGAATTFSFSCFTPALYTAAPRGCFTRRRPPAGVTLASRWSRAGLGGSALRAARPVSPNALSGYALLWYDLVRSREMRTRAGAAIMPVVGPPADSFRHDRCRLGQ